MNDQSRPDYKKAMESALSIVRQNGYVEPPISPILIASSQGVNVVEMEMTSSFNEVAGFIDIRGSRIVVNKNDPTNRQSFTIAHELGHYILHKQLIEADPEVYSVLYRKNNISDKGNPIEQEANCFAANLLVPLNILAKYQGLPISTIAILFRVSQDVIAYRLKDLDKWNPINLSL